MTRDRLYLASILDSIQRIETYTQAGYEQFIANTMMQLESS